MFKKLAADALGLSDIGSIISPEDFGKADADDYVMHEEDEKIFFLIKSKTDEYCFTDRALIHLDGTSATSKKRMLYRYPYYRHVIHNVKLETAGTMDLDVEIKFYLENQSFSIDVDKKQIEPLKDLYKALLKIEEIQAENKIYKEMANRTLELSVGALGRVNKNDLQMDEQAKKLNDYAWSWLTGARNKYVIKNFAPVFEKFINN